MKTLYESILDDEEVLIDNVKKSANDPIISLYSILLKNKTIKNNRDADNIILELSKVFKLEKSRIEIREYKEFCEIAFNNPKKYIKHLGGDIAGPGSTLLSITLVPNDNKYVLQKCNLKTKKSIAAIDNFIETHDLIVGDGTRYFSLGVFHKKL